MGEIAKLNLMYRDENGKLKPLTIKAIDFPDIAETEIGDFLKNGYFHPQLRLLFLNLAINYGYSVKLGYCPHSNNYRKMHGLHTRRKLK